MTLLVLNIGITVSLIILWLKYKGILKSIHNPLLYLILFTVSDIVIFFIKATVKSWYGSWWILIAFVVWSYSMLFIKAAYFAYIKQVLLSKNSRKEGDTNQ